MALRKFTFISTEGYSQEQAASDELSLGKISLLGVSGVAIDAGAARITNVGTATAAGDAVTKAQLDAAFQGVRDFKESARAATTANVANLATGAPSTVDGVSLAVGDRVLVRAQTTGSQNGIYVVGTVGTGANGVWSRALDADEDSEVTAGMWLAVSEGTTLADTLWMLSTDDPIVVGTTSLTFTKILTLTDLVAGAGLTKTGTTLDVGAGNGIAVDADAVRVLLGTDSGLEFVTGALEVDVDAARGIDKDSTGIFVKLGTDPGLEFSGDGLEAKVLSTGGIEKLSTGLAIKIDDTVDTLDSDASGLKVVGLPSLFKVNGSAVGATVTAANLTDVTDGGDASTLHTHDSVDKAKRVQESHVVVEAVAAGDPVAWSTTANKLAKGEAANDPDSRVVGVALAAAIADASTAIVKSGIAAGVLTGATAGAAYYLGATGGLTATVPGSGNRIILVGYAKNATDLELNIRDYGKKA